MISVAEASPQEAVHRGGSSRLWHLIARRKSNRLEPLTLVARPSGEILPVFGGAGAARDFLRRGGLGGGWRVRESAAGELVSLLLGCLPRVDRVALDPAAGDAQPRSADKKEFVAALMGEPLAIPTR
jgi:hypothetical protein